MTLPPPVRARLDRLAPDQRAAATAPAGPLLCVAPAGSGKTTTLVARIAWLVACGAEPGAVCAVTFNRRAASELSERVDAALAPLGLPPGSVRVRTFHALGREVLRSAGHPVEPLVDRGGALRTLFPDAAAATLRRLDDAFSRIKLDLGLTAAQVEGLPAADARTDVELAPRPPAREVVTNTRPIDEPPDGRHRTRSVRDAFLAYEGHLRSVNGLDFDDLVAEAVRRLEADATLLAHWRRATAHLLVDEVQDVDRTQLRLALDLAAPANRIFLVGDDDQSIYGWRLADVRRVLALGDLLPGLRRVHLETNYRCPRPVVARAVRLISHNEERYEKTIRPRRGAAGSLVLAPEPSADETAVRRFLSTPLSPGRTRAVLARTNRELVGPLAIALELGLSVHAPGVGLLLDEPVVEELLNEAAHSTDPSAPLLLRLAALRSRGGPGSLTEPRTGDDRVDRDTVLAALIAWAPAYRTLDALAVEVRRRRVELERLRSAAAPLTLATAHGTKGLEFDEVAVIGLDAGRFPSARSLADATEPARALEEERRLAYVAWTRARRSLVLVYDPAAPSPFLLEAFETRELGLDPDGDVASPSPLRAAGAPRGGQGP